MATLRDLVARVRAGRFRSSELSDPTITVTSLGERGVESALRRDLSAAGGDRRLRQGRRRGPWVVDGAIRARAVLTATLAADHRVSDGHSGALLLREIDALLQKPEAL